MAPITSIVLEYSPDPISDTSPTFTTVSNSEFMSISYWNGPSEEGGGPEPGGATIRLVNKNRKWEPLFASNVIDTHQQFRLTLNGSQRGLWFITGIQVEYPAGTEYSEVVFECADGMEVLAWDNLPLMDPPDAESYEDVVNFDEPFGYYRLGEPSGTKLIAQVRHAKRRKGEKRRRKIRRTRRVVASELGAVSGNAGQYVGLPFMGEQGFILGDQDTSVSFTGKAGANAYAKVANEVDNFSDDNKVSFGCWAVAESLPLATQIFLAGPFGTTAGTNSFSLAILTSGLCRLTIATLAGTLTCDSVTEISQVVEDGATHLMGVWDGSTARLYVNGVEEASVSGGGNLRTGNSNEFLYIGTGESPLNVSEMWLDEAVFYETALTADRIMAHYTAGSARGWPAQTAGERIADIVTNPRWSTAAVQTAGLMVQPEFKFGQSRLDVIEELAHSEGPRTMFFFNRSGNPVYLGRDWDSAGAYNTVQAVFGEKALGETPMYTPRPSYDHETFNTVTATHEAGEAVTVTDATAEGKRGRRENTEYTDLLIMEHADVETIAGQVLRMFKDPDNRVEEITVDSVDALTQQLALDVGHRVRVKWSGETGARVDRIANILRYQETLDARSRILTSTYTLSRGFDATDGLWRAGVVGFSEAGVTTVAG